MARTATILLILSVAGCNVQRSTSKPNFTGTWILDVARSSFEITPPDSTIFTIEHVEPVLQATRTHVLDGEVNVIETRFTTDSVLTSVRVGDLEIPTRVYWDGDVLILDQKWRQGEMYIANLVRYTLRNGGQTLVADEYMRAGPDSHHNMWVFARR